MTRLFFIAVKKRNEEKNTNLATYLSTKKLGKKIWDSDNVLQFDRQRI